MTNAADYAEMRIQDVDSDNIKLIYHGYVNPSRNIEILIDAMDYIDKRFSLNIMPVGDKDYINMLIKNLNLMIE